MKKRLLLSALCLFAAAATEAAVALTGDTSNPYNSLFKRGEGITLYFKVSGLAPGKKETLLLDFQDQNEKSRKTLRIPFQANEKGEWNGSVTEVPRGEYGFYRVLAKLPDGTLLQKTGSRPAGCLTYAVLPDPASRKVLPPEESFFGLHGNSTGKSTLASWIGSRWGMRIMAKNREEFLKARKNKPWVYYSYEVFRGPSSVFQQLTAAEKKGNLTGNEQSLRPLNKKGEDLFAKVYYDTAKRGLEQKGFDKVMRYQPLWEPDLYLSNDDIVRIYRIARKAIREADPDALILGPCFSHIGLGSAEAHRKLFEKGFLNLVDEVSLHPYIQYPVEENGLVENIRALKETIRQYAKGRKIGIRANESGYSARATPAEERIQMYGQVRASLILLGEGILSNEPFYGYDHDASGRGDYGLTYNLTIPHHIWATGKVAPRPVFPALAAASFLLEGHRPTGTIEYLGDTVLGYSYADRNDHCIIALWDFSGRNTDVRIETGRDSIEVADIMGNRKRMKTDKGSLALTLTEAPVYILDADPKLWGRNAERKIRPDSTELSGVSGGEITLTGSVLSDGRLTLKAPAALRMKETSVCLKKDSRYSIKMHLPQTLPEGRYPFQMNLVDETGRILASTGIRLGVRPPVAVENERAYCSPDGTFGLRFSLKNLSGNDCSGSVSSRIPGIPESRKRTGFSLKGNQSREFTLLFPGFEPSPFQKFKTELTVELKSGYRSRKHGEFNFLAADYLPGVGRNGDFSGWKAEPSLKLPEECVRSPEFHSGTEDLSAAIAFGWNEEYFLIKLRVLDDLFFQNSRGRNLWNGDSVQLGFSRQRTVPRTSNSVGEQLQLAFSEINLALTPQGPEAWRAYSFDPESLKTGLLSPQEFPRSITVTKGNGGRVKILYQVAVPWHFINLKKVRPGMSVFCAGTVNDRDAEYKKQNDVSAIGFFQLKRLPPKNFGEIILK